MLKNGCFLPNFEQLAKRGVEGARSEQALELQELREQRYYSIPKTYTLLTDAGKVSARAKTSTKLETMKATLLALLTLGSLAFAADETPITFTHATNNEQAGFNGFHFILDSSWLTANPAEYEGAVFDLEQVTLTAANTWYKLASNPSGLVILDGDNSMVGKSSWLSSGANYTFDNVKLDVQTEYTALFFGNKDAFDALTLSSIVDPTQPGGQKPTQSAPVVAAGLRVDNNNTRTDGVMIGDNGAPNVKAFPVVTFTGKVSNVPEPTTGTLSLLALAGLCIRRRK